MNVPDTESIGSYDRERAHFLLAEHQHNVHSRTDRLFARLLLFEWVWLIAFALLVSPKTWIGATSSPHIHLLAAFLLGGLVVSLPVYMVRFHPGEPATRYGIACAQMLMSSLLIHVSGGRIETHFHIFGSLAFLGFYRDWKVFVPATLVIATDHCLRGWLYPLSVFGVVEQGSWRWLEHAAWVLFCDFFLVQSALQSQAEMGRIAVQQASLEAHNLARLRAEKERFRMAFENAPIGMALLDPAGLFLRTNAVLCSMLGYSQSEMRLLNLEAMLEGEVLPGEASQEIRLQRKDGEWIWILFSQSRCADFSIAQLVDLSERKQTELALRQAQKLESVGLLAGGIAHEINTPIQYIGDNLRFLQESFVELEPLLRGSSIPEADCDYLRDEIPLAIHHSLEGVDRVAGIVRSMKEYSHAGTREMRPANLNHLIENALVMARNEWKYVAEVKKDFQSDLPEVACDRGEIGQVLLNLVVNASHAIQEKVAGTNEQGAITIQTRAQACGVEVQVRDTGAGIEEHLRSRIFEPFFTTKEVGKGTGQGLAIAQAVVLRHGGRLEVDSEWGQGTTFSLYLPNALAEVRS